MKKINLLGILQKTIRFAIVLLCVVISVVLLYPLILGKMAIEPAQILTKDNKVSDLVIGLKVIELTGDDIKNMPIVDLSDSGEENNVNSKLNRSGITLNEKALINKFNIPVIALSLNYVYLSSSTVGENDELCVEEVKIGGLDKLDALNDYGLFSRDQIIFSNNDEQVCFKSGYTDIVNEKIAFRPLLLKNPSVTEYYYPFDARILDFGLLFKGYFRKEGAQGEFPKDLNVKIMLTPSRWSTTFVEKPNYIGGYLGKEILVTLNRPWYYRCLFFVIPVIVVVALISLISIDSLGSFWEVSIGFISLWSVHEILIPNYVNSPTIIDQVITFLYLLLGLVVLFSLFSVFSHKQTFDLVQQIPVRRGKPNLIKWAENLIDRRLTSPDEIAKAFFLRAELERSVAMKNKLRDIAELYVRYPDGQ